MFNPSRVVAIAPTMEIKSSPLLSMKTTSRLLFVASSDTWSCGPAQVNAVSPTWLSCVETKHCGGRIVGEEAIYIPAAGNQRVTR